MRYLVAVLFMGCITGSLRGQSIHFSSGKISYKSSQNVYVKFESTHDINPGDTLFLQKDNTTIPVLIVTNLSSTSCICLPLSTEELSVSMSVFAKSKEKTIIEIPDSIIPSSSLEKKSDSINLMPEKKIKEPQKKQKISGSIAASNYSYFSDIPTAQSMRFQYVLTLNARNIAEPKFSVESYVSFRHEKDQWNLVQDNLFQALKIYNLSVNYDNNKNTRLSIGRKINNNISNIGAVDGIQYERKIKSLSLGVIAGSRPDYTDYRFDFTLPQFGVYISQNYKSLKGEMQNSFALIEQRNTSKIDRRFAYFQHSNSLAKNLYFFGSLELDLYKKVGEKPENTFSLSSTFLSLQYRLFKRLTLAGSYDNRKNVIYYETYKSYIQQVLDIEARQGLSFQTNYYTRNNISFGMRTGYRFPNKNSRESRNLYGYITYSKIPWVNLSSTISANYLETSYVNGKILNFNLSRDFFQSKLFTDFGYQRVHYSFYGSEILMVQNIFNGSIHWRFYKNLSFSVNYERTFEESVPNSRLVLQIRKRF